VKEEAEVVRTALATCHREHLPRIAGRGGGPNLSALGVDEGAAFAGLVEFDEHHSLPLAEEDLTINNRDGDRWLADDELAHVSVTIDELVLLEVLGSNRVIVVLVVDTLRDRFLDRPSVVVEESGFGFVDHD